MHIQASNERVKMQEGIHRVHRSWKDYRWIESRENSPLQLRGREVKRESKRKEERRKDVTIQKGLQEKKSEAKKKGSKQHDSAGRAVRIFCICLYLYQDDVWYSV